MHPWIGDKEHLLALGIARKNVGLGRIENDMHSIASPVRRAPAIALQTIGRFPCLWRRCTDECVRTRSIDVDWDHIVSVSSRTEQDFAVYRWMSCKRETTGDRPRDTAIHGLISTLNCRVGKPSPIASMLCNQAIISARRARSSRPGCPTRPFRSPRQRPGFYAKLRLSPGWPCHR